ncbi:MULTISPECIES: anti-sigma factor [Marinobacter]|uniref:Zf-HC2 domain-containing protein n=1 Tax=Marinobacter metalliresistant TaxID=2961995 RepID=A0ABZ2W379_9GAMM|nr:zf-HC2 domain-containing protein [Marinobacter sp. Arc7-DN-1]AXS81927.1 hypothetical protein D0851_02035 [Marinobacter sp. Arc7-DN-1]
MSDSNKTETHGFSDLHVRIQDWLAGYADGQLDEHHTDLVEAHLAGCEACRNDVVRQQALSARLQLIPTPRFAASFDKRLDDALAEAPVTGRHKSGHQRVVNIKHWLSRLHPLVLVGGGGWAVALVLAAVLLMPNLTPGNINQIPMVSDVLIDYQRVAREDLPSQSGGSGVPPPMQWANSRVLATWMTSVGGDPAQAYAMRRGNSLIIQYRISERVFFRNPDVRQAVARAGDFRTRDDQLEVLGIPMEESGLLVVAPAGNLPAIGEFTTEAS